MKPTQMLSSEHRVIEIVLDCLDRLTDQTVIGGKLERQPAVDIIDFIRNFADHCHHAKEEGVLFPALGEKGMPSAHGPVGVMLSEHRQGRDFVATMADSIDDAAEGKSPAVDRFVAAARGYTELLRQHIRKEDGVLFPMADRLLDESDQAEVLKRFAHVEREDVGDGAHDRYLKLAEALAGQFGVDASAAAKAEQCGCHHQA